MGKTTLICRLIPLLSARYGAVGVVKHTHHTEPSAGGDTGRCLEAGASEAILATAGTAWLWREGGGMTTLAYRTPEELIASLVSPFVLVEGFKQCQSWPRVLVSREGVEVPSLTGPVAAVVGEAAGHASVRHFTTDELRELPAFLDTITAT